MMRKEKRDSGIEQIGKIPWGTHFCQFYKNTAELTEIIIPYFKTGLENNEYCLWITGKMMTAHQAADTIRKALPAFSEYNDKKQIEFSDYDKLVSQDGTVDPQNVIEKLVAIYHKAITQGYSGMRLSTNPCADNDKSWDCCNIYEKELHKTAEKYNIIANCTYFLDRCNPAELINVDNRHCFSLLKRHDKWELTINVEQQQATNRLQTINSLLLAIRNVNQSIARIKDRDKLMKTVCRDLSEVSHYFYVWLVLINKQGNIADFFDSKENSRFKTKLADSVKGKLFDCIKHTLKQPDVINVKEQAVCTDCPLKHSENGNTVLTARLETAGQIYGVLTIVSGEKETEEEFRLIKEVADDISFGLHNIEIEYEKTRLTNQLREKNTFIQTVMDNLPIGIAVNNSTSPVVFEYMNENFPKYIGQPGKN
jgi:hypothetical protein